MAFDAAELVIASSGTVSVAPLGTALPAVNSDPTAALNAAFVDLGYVTEDGVTITVAPDVTDFRAWQSRQAVRREVNAQEISASFALEQWNEDTVPLAFGGGAITVAGGFYTYSFPDAGDALAESSLIINAVDGERVMRFVFPRVTVADTVETKFQRSELAVLPITCKALEPDTGAIAYVLFDDAAFAA